MSEPHPFEFLTQREFRLVFSIAFLETTDVFAGGYPIHKFHSPGYKGPSKDWLELILRAVRYLALEKDFEFTALDVARDGSITSAGPVCEGNAAYVLMLREGGLPDLPLALGTALRMAEEEIPSLDTEPLRAAIAQVESDRRKARHQADPMLNLERDKFRDAALKEVGIVRSTEIVN